MFLHVWKDHCLTKPQDYSARAKDFGEKKAKLKVLRQKLLDKNPDEFYFGMLSRKGPSATGKNKTGTINGDRGNQVLSHEAVRLFKTQDLGYVRTMRNKTAKEVKTLEQQVAGIRGAGKRVVYVDDEDEQLEMAADVELDDDDDDEEEDSDDEDFIPKDKDAEQIRLGRLQAKELHKLEAKLEVAKERLKSLTQAEEALDLQRAKMAKSPTVGGVNKNGVKFKIRERKR